MWAKTMVIYNAATRELTAKIVYYGPGLGGKTTNLALLHERLEPGTVGKLLNLATQTDRTIYFDLLPVELGDIKGYKIRFQLATVPGQSAFNETRRVVLKGADGIVFVADSQWAMLPKNLESWQNLKDNLKANGVSFEGIPIVVQYNKRDLSDILSVDALQEALGLSSYPFIEGVASAGRGVTETFKLISKLTFVDLLRRLQGRKPEEAAKAAAAKPERDDLLSWKDSLMRRGHSGEAGRGSSAEPAGQPKRPFALVPTPEEAPFKTADEEPAEQAPQQPAPAEGPFPDSAAPRKVAASRARAASGDLPTEKIESPEDQSSEEIPAASPDGRGAARAAFEADRLKVLEARLEQALERVAAEGEGVSSISHALESVIARLEAFERDARVLGEALDEKLGEIGARLEKLEGATAVSEAETRLRAIEERLGAAEKRQRIAEDDVSMALRSVGERGEKFSQQLVALTAQLDTLGAALDEKTSQGRREADDIRAQLDALAGMMEEKIGEGRQETEDLRMKMAALEEANERRGQAHDQVLSEFERLRESLAGSLGDLSERLRRAVRGL